MAQPPLLREGGEYRLPCVSAKVPVELLSLPLCDNRRSQRLNQSLIHETRRIALVVESVVGTELVNGGNRFGVVLRIFAVEIGRSAAGFGGELVVLRRVRPLQFAHLRGVRGRWRGGKRLKRRAPIT